MPEERYVFEAVKMQMSQSKDGWALALRLHPNDLTLDLMQLPVGTRVGVALVPIADDDGAFENRELMSRVAKEEKEEAAHKRKYATVRDGILNSPYLHMWAEERGLAGSEKQEIDNMCGSGTWKERSEEILKIAKEIQSYVQG
ncbi:MAG: hypothetical protein B7Z37_23540 [Verrucomicrobia bacterium 12-59-8]|nr:MAG: hypothetical protein B7Z37_23540 [Verrucomicrobia bacterium 12-59-8]